MLIPFWVKEVETADKIKQQTLNARAETTFEKPAFRHWVKSKRSLILIDGFFEWRHNKLGFNTNNANVTERQEYLDLLGL